MSEIEDIFPIYGDANGWLQERVSDRKIFKKKPQQILIFGPGRKNETSENCYQQQLW